MKKYLKAISAAFLLSSFGLSACVNPNLPTGETVPAQPLLTAAQHRSQTSRNDAIEEALFNQYFSYIFNLADTDQNRQLSLDEFTFADHSPVLFSLVDTNNDEKVSELEFHSYRPQSNRQPVYFVDRNAIKAYTRKIWDLANTDGDETLQADEIRAFLSKPFAGRSAQSLETSEFNPEVKTEIFLSPYGLTKPEDKNLDFDAFDWKVYWLYSTQKW